MKIPSFRVAVALLLGVVVSLGCSSDPETAGTGGEGGTGATGGTGGTGGTGVYVCDFLDIAGSWTGTIGTGTTALDLTFQESATEGAEIGTNVIVNAMNGGCEFSMECAPDDGAAHLVFNRLVTSTPPSQCIEGWYRLTLIDQGNSLQVDFSENQDGSGMAQQSILSRP